MAEPRAIEPDDAGPDAPAPADLGSLADGRGMPDAVVRVLRPDTTPPPPPPSPPGPTEPIDWLAPADPSFVVLRDDLRDDLYDDLRDDLAADLRDELRDDLRHDLRHDLHSVLRADLDADLEDLADDLYEEVDDLRDDVLLRDRDGPTPMLAAPSFQTDTEIQRARSRRVAFVAASMLAVAMIAAIVLLWQRADTVAIVAARPEPAVVAPPDLDGVLTHVEQLDQQLAGLLAVSASPATPNDVSLQIEALRTEVAGVQGCLLAVRRAVDAGVDGASAVEYC